MTEGTSKGLIGLIIHFLSLPDVYKDPCAQEIIDKLNNRDPLVIHVLQKCQNNDSLISMIATDEMIDAIREEIGAYIDNDSKCIQVLQQFKDITTNIQIQKILDRGIQFVKMEDGSDLNDIPLADLMSILDEFSNPDQLIQCIKYMATMIEV